MLLQRSASARASKRERERERERERRDREVRERGRERKREEERERVALNTVCNDMNKPQNNSLALEEKSVAGLEQDLAFHVSHFPARPHAHTFRNADICHLKASKPKAHQNVPS